MLPNVAGGTGPDASKHFQVAEGLAYVREDPSTMRGNTVWTPARKLEVEDLSEPKLQLYSPVSFPDCHIMPTVV